MSNDKVKFITWTKPSGLEIETNAEAATIEHCVSLGWKSNDKRVPKAEKKGDK